MTGSIRDISGVEVKEPASCKYSRAAVNDPDSGRSATGKMYVGLVGYVRTLQLGWNGLSKAEVSRILVAVTASTYLEVSFYDPLKDDYDTSTFYLGDHTVDFTQFIIDNERFQLGFSLIEREAKL